MKTLKWLVVSLSLLLVISANAQKKPAPSVKIVMQFEDQNNAKKYECNNIYYKSDHEKIDNISNDYDMSITSYGLADSNLLEWVANSKMLKNIRITIYKSGKSEREYMLKNAAVKTFAESDFTGEGAETYSNYDLTINAEQISINGIEMKKSIN